MSDRFLCEGLFKVSVVVLLQGSFHNHCVSESGSSKIVHRA